MASDGKLQGTQKNLNYVLYLLLLLGECTGPARVMMSKTPRGEDDLLHNVAQEYVNKSSVGMVE